MSDRPTAVCRPIRPTGCEGVSQARPPGRETHRRDRGCSWGPAKAAACATARRIPGPMPRSDRRLSGRVRDQGRRARRPRAADRPSQRCLPQPLIGAPRGTSRGGRGAAALRARPPGLRVACLGRMAAEVSTLDSGYTNRPPIHAQAPWRVRLDPHAGRQATGRAVDRMRLTLRAYEQRAQRRAALHGWLAARAARTVTMPATCSGRLCRRGDRNTGSI